MPWSMIKARVLTKSSVCICCPGKSKTISGRYPMARVARLIVLVIVFLSWAFRLCVNGLISLLIMYSLIFSSWSFKIFVSISSIKVTKSWRLERRALLSGDVRAKLNVTSRYALSLFSCGKLSIICNCGKSSWSSAIRQLRNSSFLFF